MPAFEKARLPSGDLADVRNGRGLAVVGEVQLRRDGRKRLGCPVVRLVVYRSRTDAS